MAKVADLGLEAALRATDHPVHASDLALFGRRAELGRVVEVRVLACMLDLTVSSLFVTREKQC